MNYLFMNYIYYFKQNNNKNSKLSEFEFKQIFNWLLYLLWMLIFYL